jgi:hypothetical protein
MMLIIAPLAALLDQGVNSEALPYAKLAEEPARRLLKLMGVRRQPMVAPPARARDR